MTKRNPSVTGRDDYIQSEAFVLAIGYIQRLPRRRQTWSNMNDMCKITRARFDPGNIGVYVAEFYRMTGFLIDLFPDDEDDTIDHEWKTQLDETVRNLVRDMS